MLYEKKMLILSGAGKGVVLIEKSGAGVKFTLRTFDLPARALPFKAGVVTKTKVFVRDLPHRDNPSAVFSLELDSLDGLHFAVFDRELRLYGCIGKRMWEANLMDLLNKNDRRAPDTDGVRPPLPPISTPPRVLPLPDGTGLPQSRIAVYGDDALAESDFYTKIDMSARMPVVDGFLDTPRILDGLAPEIEKPDAVASGAVAESDEPAQEVAVAADEPYELEDLPDDIDAEIGTADTEAGNGMSAETDMSVGDIAASDRAEHTEALSAGAETSGSGVDAISESVESAANAEVGLQMPKGASDGEPVTEQALSEVGVAAESVGAGAEFEPTFEAAATAMQPWERTARWIKKRSGRELVVKKPRVRATSAGEKLRQLRATEFFERARRDIDILFASARRDETLGGLIDDVEWVKVDVDGNTVSVGRSGNAFLCYAVAGSYERTPPLGEEAQWLPRDKTAPTGKGYWVIFQNLTTGEIIK